MPAEPKIAELAPSVDELTSYDKEHAVTYMRLLDADADKADWREIARIVLGLDPTVEPDRARRTFESHLTRAKWLAGKGYRDLLRSGWPRK
ncbi:DNA -binding domain-containing protein [Bradyrhizobium sp. DASA03068]|uniref:DNA -binding domain-containing protein n=1 Tax=Bradyrhizobium sp. BLXBL-01 TaxID=3395915 RepID=UPI003F70AA86